MQYEAEAVSLSDGGVMVVWTSNTGSGGSVEVRQIGRIFESNGEPRTGEFRLDFDGNLFNYRPGLGADLLVGGNGFDTATYESASAGVTASLGNSAVNAGEADGDTYTSIEGLRGSQYRDILNGTNGDNVIEGGAGDDLIKGYRGWDTWTGGGWRRQVHFCVNTRGGEPCDHHRL